MRSDQEQPGKPQRRAHSAPVPGMPYRLHTQQEPEPAADARREFSFIEVRPMAEQRKAPEGAFNSWEDQGWEGGETAFPVTREPEPLEEDQYFAPMPGLGRQAPPYRGMEAYGEYPSADPYQESYREQPYQEPYREPYQEQYREPYQEPHQEQYREPYQEPYQEPHQEPYREPYQEPYREPYQEPFEEPYREAYREPYAEPQAQPYGEPYPESYPEPFAEPYQEPYPEQPEEAADVPEPPLPPPPPPAKKTEPWRTAVILSCVAGLLFCGVEIYRIAENIVQSQGELSAYREVYLAENNEEFTRHAQAVALLPPGQTYPPTASPVPVQTPTPTPRIAQNDPLIAAMSGGMLDPNQSVTPETPTPALRSAIARYPANPLLVMRSEIEALQTGNADIVGRLVIDGVMNELVVLRNNTYYLNHNAEGAYSGYGAVFADENVNFRVPPENILLYGRTSNEGKTFAPLKNYVSQGIGFAGRNAFLSFNSLYEEARYVIVSVIEADASPSSANYFNYKRVTFATDADMLSYAQEAISRSLYIFSVGVVPTDRLLTLVTLSDGTDSDAIVIVCRMLRDGERDGLIQPN